MRRTRRLPRWGACLAFAALLIVGLSWFVERARWHYRPEAVKHFSGGEWVELGEWADRWFPTWLMPPERVYVIRWHRKGLTREYVVCVGLLQSPELRGTTDGPGLWVVADGTVMGSVDRRTGEVLDQWRARPDPRVSWRRQAKLFGEMPVQRPFPQWATPSGGIRFGDD